jgi:hypothetical protein
MFAKLKQKTIEERPKAQSPKPTPPEADGKAKVNIRQGHHWVGVN